MADPTGGWASFFINQGVAIAVLAFLLVRLESRMTRLEQLLQQLADRSFAQAGGTVYVPPTTPKQPA